MRRATIVVAVASASTVVWCLAAAWHRSGKGSGFRVRPRPVFVPYISYDYARAEGFTPYLVQGNSVEVEWL